MPVMRTKFIDQVMYQSWFCGTWFQRSVVSRTFAQLKLPWLSADERERPELLAESRERRRRVAKDSGKTEQQVRLSSYLHPPYLHDLVYKPRNPIELNWTFLDYQVSQLVSQLFQMRARMQKMMAGMQGKDTDMGNLMESIKSEEQVKASARSTARAYYIVRCYCVLWSLRLCLTLIIQAAAGAGQPRRKYGNLRRRDLDRMRGYRRWDARLGGDVVVADDHQLNPMPTYLRCLAAAC
jgi:signal recognition particle subunit SRP54